MPRYKKLNHLIESGVQVTLMDVWPDQWTYSIKVQKGFHSYVHTYAVMRDAEDIADTEITQDGTKYYRPLIQWEMGDMTPGSVFPPETRVRLDRIPVIVDYRREEVTTTRGVTKEVELLAFLSKEGRLLMEISMQVPIDAPLPVITNFRVTSELLEHQIVICEL